MRARKVFFSTGGALLLGIALLTASPRPAAAHCDTLDGPVVTEARQALDKGDVTAVLKWVRKEDEGEVRAAFGKALAVRGKGKEARELADLYFFETLVRVHRAGEGEPYTGLKPAGPADPAIDMADRALESGNADRLVKAITEHAAKGIRERFERVLEKKRHAGESVPGGREYVAAYVEFVHYVERLHRDLARHAAHHEAEPAEHRHGH